jgi:cephalosporin-C deacetylase-like acetyl esterase
MEEEKFTILNENELEIKGIITRPKKSGKFPVIILSQDILDTSETQYIKDLCKMFLDKNIAVLRFDYTNSFGRSGGRIENITISQCARDLELVIQYVKRRAYTNEQKICAIGFGFGAMSTLVLEGFHALTKAIVLVNTPSQIDDTSWTSFQERDMLRVKLKRYFHVHSEGKEVRINYSFFEDGYRLDMFRCARNLRTPVLYVTGFDNQVVRPLHSERLYERTNSKKESESIAGFAHDVGKKHTQIIFDKSFNFFKKQKAI